MPNYVRNNVYFRGAPNRLAILKQYMTTEENQFDFNKLIHMPEELSVDAGSTEKLAIACAKSLREGKHCNDEYAKDTYAHNKSFEEWAKIGEVYLSNIEKYGVSTWYDWCCNNWGTKWNACEASWEGNEYVSFDTAWSVPIPIFEKLKEVFPDVKFHVDYADEDLGNNCGTIDWDRDVFTTSSFEDLEFACDVWDYDYDEILAEMEEE